MAKKYGLKTMVIAQNSTMVLRYDQFDIDYISYENEELIASTTSMIDNQESEIKNLVKKLKHPLIIGAGINDSKDIKKFYVLLIFLQHRPYEPHLTELNSKF